MAEIWKVEGGISGSMHRRGPWHYLTKEEAEAKCEADAYPEIHPACSDIGLGCSPVEVPDGLVKCLAAAVAKDEGWIRPALLHANGLDTLLHTHLVEYEEYSRWENRPRVTELGRRLVEAMAG